MTISKDTLKHYAWRYSRWSEDNKTPKFHYLMVEHYLSNKYAAIKAFRGSAKTTNTAYMALYLANLGCRYTLIVSDTATQAESIVDDITSLAEEGGYDIVRAVRGELEIKTTNGSYYIVGKGSGASMRGIKRGRSRPDTIILDDILNDEIVRNSLRIDRLNRWFFASVLPSLDPNGRVWVVGTPFTKKDLFSLLCDMYPTLEIPILVDGKSSWADRFSDEWIAAKKDEYNQAGMLVEWKREYELVVADSESRIFDIDKIRFIEEHEVPSDLTYYITLDGAFSEKDSADKSAFSVVGIDSNGIWYVRAYAMRGRPQEVIDKLFALQARYGALEVGIEKGAFKLSMEAEIERRMLDYQQYFNINELSVAGSKISRIKALAPVIASNRLVVVDTEDAEELVEQLELTTNEGVMAKHDDLVDSLCQMLMMPITLADKQIEQTLADDLVDEYDSDWFSKGI